VLAADPGEDDVAKPAAQRDHEMGTQAIAGWLAGDKKDPNRALLVLPG
jgi:hypothetical protein